METELQARRMGLYGNAQGNTRYNFGVKATASGSGSAANYGIYSTASGGTVNYAGYFEGNLHVTAKATIGEVLRLQPLTAAPANPQKGDIYFDGINDVIKYFNGTVWKTLTTN
jgi:hypothetical protein